MVLVVKNLPANAGDIRDTGSIPGLGRSSGGGQGNPLQYSYLENPMDRGAWLATVHGVVGSDVTHSLSWWYPLEGCQVGLKWVGGRFWGPSHVSFFLT